MMTRELKVLILGDVPEVSDIFERDLFQEELPASPIDITDAEDFAEVVQQAETYDLVLIDISPHGIEVLETVRDSRPTCPVIMIGDPSEADKLLEAKRRGLEAYLLRGVDGGLFTNLLAEEIYTQLKRFVEPPTMESPSADQMYRYAQFHNVLEPFFVVARRRYLMYVNKAGQELIDSLHDNKPKVGDPVESWVLEHTPEEFTNRLDQAFAGHPVVQERHFDRLADEDGTRELHYQPVTDPKGRVVAVSIAVGEPARPERQRARTMQQLTGLAATVSHENNNMLNVLMSNTELLAHRLDELGDDEALKRLDKIRGAITRATEFTQQLQAFSQTSVSQPEPIDLSDLIERLSDSLGSLLPEGVDLRLALDLELPAISADPDHWRTAVMTLVQSGASAMSKGDTLTLKTRSLRVTPKLISARRSSVPVGPGDYVVLEVICEGDALEDWMRTRLFDPFCSRRGADRHAGLQLATVKSIIEQGGGRVSTEAADGPASICIYYPALDSSLDSPSEKPDDPPSEQQEQQEENSEPKTILFVEDATFLRETFADILSSSGYDVLSAETIDEARNLVEGRSEPISLLITDLVLPGGSGVDLVDELTDKWPHLDVVFVSGHSPTNLPEVDKAAAQHIFLRKPVPVPTLLETVGELLDNNQSRGRR